MDLLKLLESLQEALYEISMWLIMIPKTFYQVVVRPASFPPYVEQELAKEKKQFESIMPPILFWLLLTVIPGFFATKYLTHYLDIAIKPSAASMIAYLGIAFSAVILAPVILIQAFAGGDFTREALRKNFYLQCYVQTPFQFTVIVCMGILKRLHYNFNASNNTDYQYFNNNINGYLDYLMAPVILALVWLVWAQVKIIRAQTKRGTGNALLILTLSYFLWAILFVATALLGLLNIQFN